MTSWTGGKATQGFSGSLCFRRARAVPVVSLEYCCVQKFGKFGLRIPLMCYIRAEAGKVSVVFKKLVLVSAVPQPSPLSFSRH